MIEFKNVSLSKEDEQGSVEILQDLSFSIEAGSIFALAGPSGSGKSSALRLINRLDDCSAGEVFIDGREIRSWDVRELRAKVGFMFQEAALFEGSVMENLLYGPCLQGLKKCNYEPAALELLEKVGLPQELLRRNVESLSGGQKQRVNLARTLALDPEIILMDEPTSSLDPAAAGTIEKLVLQLNREGKTFVMVSHNLDQIARIAQACAVLASGRLVFLGEPEQLFADQRIVDLLREGKEDQENE